jgi:Fe2+ transport system protein FeoA
VALAEVGRFGEAVQYLQKAAKALYEAAKEVFEQVKVTVQRLVELFVEAAARVLAWVDERKAYFFLMAAAATGAVALSAALNLWGLVEMEKLANAASLTPFIPGGVREYSREEVFNILKNDPYERFKEIAKAANAGVIKLPQPWESLRVLIMPRPSEESRLMKSKTYRELDERKKKGLFYAVLALEEAFGVYRTALREVGEGLREVVQRVEVGEGPFKRVRYMLDVGRLAQLAEEEGKAFEDALKIHRERLNEYAVKYGLRDLLDVKEDMARELAEAEKAEFSEFSGVNFGVKAYAALIAYREYALSRWGAFGKAAWYWLEVGGSAWLLYYAPRTAYQNAKRAEVEGPVAVEELVVEGLRRLFLKPGADRYRDFVEELIKSGKLALELEKIAKSKNAESYVFRLYRIEEGGGLKELGIKLRIAKVEEWESIVYTLELNAKWQEFFKHELEAAMKAAEEVGGRLPVKDHLLYMAGWDASDVAILRKGKKRVLVMATSHLWQLAETQALFGWSDIAVFGVGLTLEGPKPRFRARTSLEKLNEAIRRSAEGGWLKMLGVETGLEDLLHVKSWDDLKRWVAGHWGIVVETAVRRLGEGVGSELEALRDRLNDDKIAREVVAPALLLMQAERLGVNETTLRYFGAVVSGAIDGDGSLSATEGKVVLASGKRAVAQLWVAVLAAHDIETKTAKAGGAFQVVASGGDAVKLAGLYFLYGAPLLEGDEKVINYKLAEAVKLGAGGLSVSWEGLRRTEKGLVAADLIISVSGVAVKYNVYLSEKAILFQFASSDRGRVELAARLLRIAGVGAEVRKVGGSDIWYVIATTDVLAAGHVKLRDAVRKVVEEALEKGWVDEKKAELWLEKLERGLTLMEGWPKYEMRLDKGTLVVRYRATDPDSIKQVAQRLREMGLVEGKHFSMKKPEEGRDGYVRILKEGLAYAAWLSVHGTEGQRDLAARFVEYILRRAEEAGKEVYDKATKIVEEGMSRGSLRLEGFERKVEVNGKEHVVKVIGWGAEREKSQSGKKLLKIRITAEINNVKSDYTITFSRYGRTNTAEGRAYARSDTPEVREADAERYSALIKALTGKEPNVYRMKDGRIKIACYEGHLEGFRRFTELADAIEKWLEETER